MNYLNNMTDDEYFNASFDRLMFNEGGYSNNPDDAGGETMWGITKETARAHGYLGDIKDMSQDTAKQIYRKGWWDKLKFAQFDNPIKFHLFDAGVNHGLVNAVKILQCAVGVKNDGVLGPITMSEVSKQINDMDKLIAFFYIYRGKFYRSIKTFKNFGIGWENRIDNNTLYYYETQRGKQ